MSINDKLPTENQWLALCAIVTTVCFVAGFVAAAIMTP